MNRQQALKAKRNARAPYMTKEQLAAFDAAISAPKEDA